MIAIDGHVHLYKHFSLSRALASAYLNLKGMAGNNVVPVLFLANTIGADGFERIKSNTLCDGTLIEAPEWTVRSTFESESMLLNGALSEILVIIRGQQLVTSEGIEMLIIGHGRMITSNEPLSVVIETVDQDQAFIILPWGVGKWLGRRGRIIDDVLRSLTPDAFSLGDNSARPFFWPELRFRLANRLGVRVLPGSDPLPITRAEARIGEYGFVINKELNLDTPWKQLRGFLKDSRVEIRAVGQRLGLRQFMSEQIAVRLKKRSRPRLG